MNSYYESAPFTKVKLNLYSFESPFCLRFSIYNTFGVGHGGFSFAAGPAYLRIY